MAMVILTAEERPTEYYFRVHIDDTQVLADGSPNPSCVREFRWGTDQDIEVSKIEMKRLCELELQRLQATTLADEGQTL